MDFEKIYAKLPDSIKYNNYILDFFLKIPKKLQNLNKKSNQLNSQNQLLDLLFTSCDIKIKGNLRNVQLLYIELLRFVDNVCKKHDIDYWLEGGTLIGAVRHGGFIPWDDDIDLSIMRKDYEKLIKVLPEEISKYGILIESAVFKRNCLQTINTRKLTYEQKYAVKKPFDQIIKEINETIQITICTFVRHR